MGTPRTMRTQLSAPGKPRATRRRHASIVAAALVLLSSSAAWAGVGMFCEDPQEEYGISLPLGSDDKGGLSLVRIQVGYPGKPDSELYWRVVSGATPDFDRERLDLVAHAINEETASSADEPAPATEPRALRLHIAGSKGVLEMPERSVALDCSWELG